MLNTILVGAAKLLRGLVFVILLAFQPLAEKLLLPLSGICGVLCIATLILAPHQLTPILAFLTVALVAAGVNFLLQWVLVMLAPPGFVMGLGD